MNTKIIGVLVVIVVLVGGWFMFGTGNMPEKALEATAANTDQEVANLENDLKLEADVEAELEQLESADF